MPYVAVNDIQMYYEEDGKGTPIVLMHGATGTIDQPDSGWSGMMGLFARQYRAIHIEHRGHGRTNNPQSKLTYAMIADDVCKFIEHLSVGPVHIGGVSDGAIVALQIGMTRPDLVRTLVCVGANYYNDDLVLKANKELADMKYGTPDLYARMHDRNKHPGYWQELMKQLNENLAVNPNYSLGDLSKISAPTLLLAGENDLWGNPQQMLDMHRVISKSEMLIINNAGHIIQHTHPDIVGPVVLEFLARHQNSEELKEICALIVH